MLGLRSAAAVTMILLAAPLVGCGARTHRGPAAPAATPQAASPTIIVIVTQPAIEPSPVYAAQPTVALTATPFPVLGAATDIALTPTPQAMLPQPVPVERVRVSLLGVTIGPGKMDGTQWDLLGNVPSSVWGGVTKALGMANPYAGVASFLAQGGYGALQKPDIGGSAELFGGGGAPGASGSQYLGKIQDAFTPTWAGKTWTGVELTPKTSMRVYLMDRDAFEDDPVGNVDIGYADLVRAKEAGGGYPVDVSTQTDRQVLFVKIAVAPE